MKDKTPVQNTQILMLELLIAIRDFSEHWEGLPGLDRILAFSARNASTMLDNLDEKELNKIKPKDNFGGVHSLGVITGQLIRIIWISFCLGREINRLRIYNHMKEVNLYKEVLAMDKVTTLENLQIPRDYNE